MPGCIVTGVFRLRIEMMVIDGKLTTEVIYDVRGSRPACFVYAYRRAVGFRWRCGPDEPDAQVIGDGADHRRVFDAADDAHGSQGISGRPKDRPHSKCSEGVREWDRFFYLTTDIRLSILPTLHLIDSSSFFRDARKPDPQRDLLLPSEGFIGLRARIFVPF